MTEHIFKKFTGRYSISKTLRFELKPVGATKNFMDDLKKNLKDHYLKSDFERNEAYPEVKNILDDYYRYFIDTVLASDDLAGAKAQKIISEAYKAYIEENYEEYEDQKMNCANILPVFLISKKKNLV